MVDKQQIWERLASYFAGNSTEQEQKELEQWLHQATDEEKQLYNTAKKLWQKTSLEKGSYSPDVNNGWQRFQLKVSMREKRKKAFPFGKIAAAILVLILFTFLLLMNDNQPKMLEVSTSEKIEQVILPDGSQIWLNRNSILSYSEDYDVNNREVYLSGEAFFEVEKAEGKRFTVLTKTTKTEVLGTSFNLEALPDKPVKLQVTTGKVAFATLDDKKAVFLEPGEEAIYSNQQKGPIRTSLVKDPNYRAWQNKQLTFNNTNLHDIATTLEEYFNTTIVIPEELKKCRFTVSFKHPEIQQVLDVLAMAGNLQVKDTNGSFTFAGQGCNE